MQELPAARTKETPLGESHTAAADELNNIINQVCLRIRIEMTHATHMINLPLPRSFCAGQAFARRTVACTPSYFSPANRTEQLDLRC